MNEQLFSSLHVDESLLGDLFGSLSQLRQAAGDFA